MKSAIALAFLLACCGVLLGDSPDPGRQSREPALLLEDLVRLTNAGFSDETVLAYAKAHRAELPSEVSTDDLLWLRKSGVNETVIRYMAAIEVRASDEGAQEDVAYDSEEAAGYPPADYSYPEGYPDSYYGDYYPFFGDGYYPYPAYFFVNAGGFFGRFHRRGHGFIRHGGFGRPRAPSGFDRGFGRRRGGIVVGHRGPGSPAFPRDRIVQGSREPRGGVVRRGGFGRPVLPRARAVQGFRAPLGGVARHGGFGPRSFSGGGHSGGGGGRAPIVRSGGGAIGRPTGSARR